MGKSPTNKQLLPLHTHTVHSVLDGASDIDEYLKWCKDNGASALGVTDHGWTIGALDLVRKANKVGITPLPGCEFYLAPEQNYVFERKPYDYYHVTAWAVNEVGYRNLLKLGSLSFEPGDIYNDGRKKSERVVQYFGGRQRKPRLTFDELLTYNKGLVLGSGCLIGSLNKAFLNGENRGAENNLTRLLEVYKGRLFIEIMPHQVTHDWDRKTKTFKLNECTDFSPDGDVQKACNILSIETAHKHKLPLLMTVDAHFVNKEQHEVQTVLLQNGDPDGWHFYNSYHMLTTNQAWDHWRAVHGDDKKQRLIFSEAVENNYQLSELAKGFTITDKYHQPDVKLDKDIIELDTSKSQKLKVQLLRAVDKHERMKWGNEKYEERLKTELAVICDNGIIDFSNYFLFLEYWNRWTREHSILSAPGRGSGAGSLLCYLLKITHLDPFRYNLPFERFLSQGRLKRGKFPDIDWDLGNRDVLLAKLSETYGDKFAQCSTHGTLKVKSAIKDACRVLLKWNAQDKRVDSVTKTLPKTEPEGVSSKDFLLGYTDADGHHHDGNLESNLKLKEFFDAHKDVYEMVLKLLGIPRSVGRHASAYFISDESIQASVPTCDISGHRCTQYTAVPSEEAGLIKFDFLRVNTLSDIAGAIRLVQQKHKKKVWKKEVKFDGKEFDIWQGELSVEKLPMDDGRLLDIYDLPKDPRVYADFNLGLTQTVFQMNTSLLTNFCKRIHPKNISDLSAIVALVRPGPLSAVIEDGKTTMTEAYIKRKDGEMAITYAHPDMEPILKETYGVAVYQEQLQQMFSDLAGYTPEEADEMREILAKKKKQKVEKAIPELRKRLKDRKWTDKQIKVFVNLCIASASYSFNKSHSACSATVAYQCMFIKHYYPLEWWTSVLQNAKVEDIRDKGYAVAIKDILELPHANGPMKTFELIDGKVHAPLYLIDGIGAAACQAIEKERKKCDFLSFQNFFERVDKRVVSKDVMHSMILCNAFDKIEDDLSIKELLHCYHTLRRVTSLRIGQKNIGTKEKPKWIPKTGFDLINACASWKKKDGKLDVPELYQDDVELEVQRLRLLPIYRLDVHEHFKKVLEQNHFLYGSPSNPRTVTYRKDAREKTLLVLRTQDDVDYLYDSVLKNNPRYKVGWVGLLQRSEEFTYKDKKTNKQVTALKSYIANDGCSLECILWPNLFEQKGITKESAIIFCKGTIKKSREPGKWSMSVSEIIEI